MERRNFLKTIGLGAMATTVSAEWLSAGSTAAVGAEWLSTDTAPTEQLPTIGLITGSGGNRHSDGFREGLKKKD